MEIPEGAVNVRIIKTPEFTGAVYRKPGITDEQAAINRQRCIDFASEMMTNPIYFKSTEKVDRSDKS